MVKKLPLFLCLIIAILFIAGCASTESEDNTMETSNDESSQELNIDSINEAEEEIDVADEDLDEVSSVLEDW